MTKTVSDALQSLRPGQKWSAGNTYSGIGWYEQSPKPTEQEVLDEIVRLEALEISEAQREAAEDARQQAITASTYVTDWDTSIKGKTFLEIKTLYDGATQAQKSDLLLYLLLVRAREVKG